MTQTHENIRFTSLTRLFSGIRLTRHGFRQDFRNRRTRSPQRRPALSTCAYSSESLSISPPRYRQDGLSFVAASSTITPIAHTFTLQGLRPTTWDLFSSQHCSRFGSRQQSFWKYFYRPPFWYLNDSNTLQCQPSKKMYSGSRCVKKRLASSSQYEQNARVLMSRVSRAGGRWSPLNFAPSMSCRSVISQYSVQTFSTTELRQNSLLQMVLKLSTFMKWVLRSFIFSWIQGMTRLASWSASPRTTNCAMRGCSAWPRRAWKTLYLPRWGQARVCLSWQFFSMMAKQLASDSAYAPISCAPQLTINHKSYMRQLGASALGTVTLKADVTSKSRLAAFWGIYAAVFVLSLILLAAVPPTTVSVKETAVNSSYKFTYVFQANESSLTQSRDQPAMNASSKSVSLEGFQKGELAMVLFANLIPKVGATMPQNLALYMRLKVMTYTEPSKMSTLFDSGISYNLSMQERGTMPLIYIYIIREPNYYVTVEFSKTVNLSLYFEDCFISAKVVNAKYANFLVAIRYVFFSLSIVALIIFCFLYKEVDFASRAPEQSATLGLGIGLIFFNDPFFAAYLYNPGNASSFFSSFFLASFLSVLFSYWSNMLTIIKNEPRTWAHRVTALLVMVCVFVASIVYHRSTSMVAPFVDRTLTREAAILHYLTVAILVLISIYLLALGVGSLRVDNLLWRHKTFLGLFFIFVVVTLICFGTLAFNMFSYVGKGVILVVINFNLMVWAQLYLHSPAEVGQAAQLESQRNSMDHSYDDLQDIEIALQDLSKYKPAPARTEGDNTNYPLQNNKNIEDDAVFQFG